MTRHRQEVSSDKRWTKRLTCVKHQKLLMANLKGNNLINQDHNLVLGLKQSRGRHFLLSTDVPLLVTLNLAYLENVLRCF